MNEKIYIYKELILTPAKLLREISLSFNEWKFYKKKKTPY